MRHLHDGHPFAKTWIIGEAPGVDEISAGVPFVGLSGQELNRQLAEVGIARRDCFLVNVTSARPPSNKIKEFFLEGKEIRGSGIERFLGLYPKQEIREGWDHLRGLLVEHKPNLIIALGNTALWALTGKRGASLAPEGISKWRGSELRGLEELGSPKVIPTYHPSFLLHENYSDRPFVLADLRRAARERGYPEIIRPDWQWTIRPSLIEVTDWLNEAIMRCDYRQTPIAVDIETRHGQIATVGLALDKTTAISIPFLCVERREGYWDFEEELLIIPLLQQLLEHNNIRAIFQNGAYDLQYFAKQWGYLPNISDDTMLMSHVCFPDQQKDLGFLASLHCVHYAYWKDDGKEWDARIPEEQLWGYNCEDCCRTFEIWQSLNRAIDAYQLREQYDFQMKRIFPMLVRMMLRGIAIDPDKRARLNEELDEFALKANTWLNEVLGHPFNPNSPRQMHALFYNDFRERPILHRKTKKPTLDDDAMERIAKRSPLLAPLIKGIGDMRSALVVKRNTVGKSTSADGRMRCTFNAGGANTFRFSSSEDCFGTGMNLQNITKGEEE